MLEGSIFYSMVFWDIIKSTAKLSSTLHPYELSRKADNQGIDCNAISLDKTINTIWKVLLNGMKKSNPTYIVFDGILKKKNWLSFGTFFATDSVMVNCVVERSNQIIQNVCIILYNSIH